MNCDARTTVGLYPCRRLSLLLLVVFTLATCAAQDGAKPLLGSIYVNVANPNKGDGSESDPYNSILLAVSRAQPGSTINVAGGIYFEPTPTEIPAARLPLTISPGWKVAAGVDITFADPTNCFNFGGNTYQFCPQLFTRDKIKNPGGELVMLEPSGLSWDPNLRIWVGVSDNYNELYPLGALAASYAIFGFEDNVPVSGKIQVFPLLNADRALEYKVYDLEGLARTKTGDYYATGSLSLDCCHPAEDRWYRFQTFHFRLQAGPSKPGMTDMNWMSEDYRRDMREWMISGSGFPWELAQIQSRAEHGGLNIEAISSDPDGNLVYGFRGPGFESGRYPMLMRVTPAGKDQAPVCLDVGFISVTGGNSPFGFRGLSLVDVMRGLDAYVFLVGPMGDDYNPIYAGVLESPKDHFRVDELTQIGTGTGLVPEGIAVKSIDLSRRGLLSIEAGIVDDLKARFMKVRIQDSGPDLGPPFKPSPCQYPRPPVAHQ